MGYGPQHGLNPAGLFASFPGWRVHAPADPTEYLGVLNSALECDDPVLLVEFSSLYKQEFDLIGDAVAARLPLRGARTVRTGSDVSIFTYGLGLQWAESAADRLAERGRSAEVVDLRALDHLSLDLDAVRRALDRTGCGLFVEPAARAQAVAPTIIADLVAGVGTSARLGMVACADVQPVAAELERQAIVSVEDVVEAADGLIRATVGPR